MKRVLIPLVLALVVVCGSLSGLSSVALSEDDTGKDPHILIGTDRWMPEYNAGEKVSLDIPIENTGEASATQAVISLAVNDPDKFPFKTDKMSLTHYSASISSGVSIVSFKVTIPPNVKPGIYPINVNVSYMTPSGGSGQASGTVFVKINNSYKQPILRCAEIQFAGDKLPAGKTTQVNLKILNDGDLALQDVEVHLGGFSANTLSLDKSPDTQNIRKMSAGESRILPFRILADKELKTGIYTLDLTLKYEDEYNQEYSKESKIYIPVAGKDSQDDFTPRIILEDYDFGSASITAGSPFPLSLAFTNTSSSQAVHNIKISFTSDGQIFSPVKNSNSLYIRKLEPQETVSKTLTFKPKANAENQTYNISVDIDFQDSQGNKLTEKELISIPVSQTLKFVLAGVETPPEVTQDTPQSISINYHNAGKAIIRNLSLKVTGDFEVKDGEQYLGNLESGKNDYCDVTVIAHKTGTLQGSVVMEYDDDNGQHFSTAKDFTLQAVAAVPPEMPGPAIADKPPAPWWKKWWTAAGAAAVLLTAAIAIVVKRRRRAKEEMLFADEQD